MIQLQIDSSLEVSVDQDLLKRTANLVLERSLTDQDSDLGVLLSSDEKVRKLNRDYRKIDQVTDVLSFPSMEIDPDSGNLYLGDVIIAIPRAKHQAEKVGHDLQAELQLLIIHGVLHLLGYDHADPAGKEKMWNIQQSILNELGLSGIQIITEQESY